MDVKTLLEFKKLITLCRKQGVESFRSHSLEFRLSPNLPIKKLSKKELEDTQSIINESQLSEEDLMFWSSAGIPNEGKVKS